MPPDPATNRAALERLAPFIGEWSMEAAFPGAGPSPSRGRTTFEWALGGSHVLQRAEVDHPKAPDVHAVIAAAADGTGYMQHYFDSRGVARLYAMTFDDGVWELRRTAPDFSPLDFSQRFVGRFVADDSVIDGRWETSRDGVDWELDFGLTYTRLGDSAQR
jgi:hypothetical protein